MSEELQPFRRSRSRGKLAAPSEVDFDLYTRLLNKRDLAKLIGKSVRSVEYLMKARTIPHVKLGASVRFRLKDVERALGRLTIKEVE
jgi:predicted DNA-binding transcriptional regulator AlpA